MTPIITTSYDPPTTGSYVGVTPFCTQDRWEDGGGGASRPPVYEPGGGVEPPPQSGGGTPPGAGTWNP